MFRLLPTRVPTHGTRHRHARKQPPTRTAVLSSHFADPLTLDNNDRSSQRTRAQPSISTRQHNFNCLIREAEPPPQPPRITDAATWAQSPPACRLRNQQLVEARVESTQLQSCARLVGRSTALAATSAPTRQKGAHLDTLPLVPQRRGSIPQLQHEAASARRSADTQSRTLRASAASASLPSFRVRCVPACDASTSLPRPAGSSQNRKFQIPQHATVFRKIIRIEMSYP